MKTAYSRLDQALRDLIEAYAEIETELENKFSDDDESFSNSLIESLEGAIESAIEEQDFNTSSMAAVLSNLTEALAQLDPSAFEEGEDDELIEEDEDLGDDDVEDADLDDYDEDEEMEDEDDD